MKTLLLICNKVPHYRVSVYNYLHRRFRERGWEFKVASDTRLRESDQELKCEFHEIRFGFFRYRHLVRTVDPDAVILHLHLKIPMFWPLLHWLKLKRIPVISWTKGANLDWPDSRVRHELFNYTHRLSDALLMYSPNETSHIKPAYRHKIFPANNTVNFEDYPDIADGKEQIKAEFDIPFQKVVLFVGTMGIGGERKRVRHLIEVFRGIDRPDLGLVLVGSGMSDELKSCINLRNTRVLGAVHDAEDVKISKLFKAADVYVVPGHVGLGINQAFYWGLPVVTEDCHQPPEIHYLVSGRNGFIVPDNDLEALRAKMLYLLDNDAVRAQFSRNAHDDIRREASIEGMFHSFLKATEYVCLAQHDIPPAERDVKAVA
jgi:glycosyltransferase involved in cell wall biosynthesis